MLNLFKNTFAAVVLAGLFWVGAALADVNLPGLTAWWCPPLTDPGLWWDQSGIRPVKRCIKPKWVTYGFHRHTRLSRPAVAKGRYPLIVMSHGSGGAT